MQLLPTVNVQEEMEKRYVTGFVFCRTSKSSDGLIYQTWNMQSSQITLQQQIYNRLSLLGFMRRRM